jgi:polyhydroxybutyrate depolymerase
MIEDRPRRHEGRFVLTLIGIILVAGCGLSVAPSSTPDPSPPRGSGPGIATAAPTASHEASSAPSASPDLSVKQLEPVIESGDDARQVRVFVPDPLPTKPVPLVLFLHASGETPAVAVRDTRFDALAGHEGFIAAFAPPAGRAWAAQVTPGLSDSDVDERYLIALIDALVDQLPVDPDRIYVAGFSLGAVMAGRMACQHADRIAAAAIVAGAPWVGQACAPSQPVSILIIHGTGDGTLRYSGAEQLAGTWRDLDSCPPPGSPVPLDPGVSVETATDCDEGTSVSFVTVDGGWHTWFTTPDATALAWRFFAEHGRR